MRYASLPPSSIHAGVHLICSSSFHPLSLCLFDMLRLLLSHMPNGIFFALSVALFFCCSCLSFCLFCALSLSTSLQWKHETVCKVLREVLFSICYLYPLLTPSSPFTPACQSLSFLPPLFSPLVLSVLLWWSFVFSSLSISSPLLTCPPPPLSSPFLFIFQASHRCSIFSQLFTPELIGC